MVLSASWNTKRVFITYRNLVTGAMEPGTYKVETSARITNTLAGGTKQVFRPGQLYSGALNTTEGTPSLDLLLPITDDPDNSPQGGVVTLTISFTGGGQETFALQPLSAWSGTGTDLATILDPSAILVSSDLLLRGVAGGVAGLDVDGDVINAAGVKVIAQGGSGGTPAAGSITDSMVASNAGILLSKVADTAAYVRMLPTERTKLAGIATGATANQTDAYLTSLANATGTLSADLVIDGTTNHAFTAADDDKLANVDRSDVARISTPQSTEFAKYQKLMLGVMFVPKDTATGFWPSGYNATTGAPVYTGGSATIGVRPTASRTVMCIWTGGGTPPGQVTSGTGGFMSGVDILGIQT